jgi:hypothetical protein
MLVFRTSEQRKYTLKPFCGAISDIVCFRNAGFFLWIDLSVCLHELSWEAEDVLKQRLYDYGVEMSSGRAYHAETPGRFRFLFSVDRDTVLEGLRRYVTPRSQGLLHEVLTPSGLRLSIRKHKLTEKHTLRYMWYVFP